jgi:hypothetical protein
MASGIAKLLSKASIQKVQNRPSTQLTQATSCVERNAMIVVEEISNYSSY